MSKKTILTGLGICLIAATAGFFIYDSIKKKNAVTATAPKLVVGDDKVNFVDDGGDDRNGNGEAHTKTPGVKKKRKKVTFMSIVTGISEWDKKMDQRIGNVN